MNSQKVLVTGGFGFLAQAVLRLLPKSWTPSVLVRPDSGNRQAFGGRIYESVDVIPADDAPDAILHLAALVPAAGPASTANLVAVNEGLVATLAERFPSARHVLASSVSVFDPMDGPPITMRTPVGGVTLYGRTKLAAESLVRARSSYAIIRFSSIIGPGMRPGTFISAVVRDAQMGLIKLVGDGSRLQDYIDVNDAAAMCVRALDATASFSTLGVSGRSVANHEVADILADLTGAKIEYLSGDQGPSFAYRLNDAFDLGPAIVTLPNSLKRMLP